jgi:hypothetical protein
MGGVHTGTLCSEIEGPNVDVAPTIDPVGPQTSSHDAYGKNVIEKAAGRFFDGSRQACRVDYGGQPHTGAFIDGTAGALIAIEVEARVSKQIRGAVLDLLCHRYPKKLLIIQKVWAQNSLLCAAQCESALLRWLPARDFRVIVLEGTGKSWQLQADVDAVRRALIDLGLADLASSEGG